MEARTAPMVVRAEVEDERWAPNKVQPFRDLDDYGGSRGKHPGVLQTQSAGPS